MKRRKMYYSRGGLGVFATGARARRRLSISSGGNDNRAWDHQWKAAQFVHPVLWRRVLLRPKLICSFLPRKHYVVLYQLLRFYLDHGMRLVKLLRAIRFKFSPYVASYTGNNTAKRQQYKHDDVKKAFYYLMNHGPYGMTIDNVARWTVIRLLNDMVKAQRLAEKPHCIDFCVFHGQVAPPEEQIEAAVTEEQQQQEALVGIEIRKPNYFIKNRLPLAPVCSSTASWRCMRLVYLWFDLTIS